MLIACEERTQHSMFKGFFSFQILKCHSLEKKRLLNIDLFLHMLLKFENIWTKIGQVINLQNINFSELVCMSQMISNVLQI